MVVGERCGEHSLRDVGDTVGTKEVPVVLLLLTVVGDAGVHRERDGGNPVDSVGTKNCGVYQEGLISLGRAIRWLNVAFSCLLTLDGLVFLRGFSRE